MVNAEPQARNAPRERGGTGNSRARAWFASKRPPRFARMTRIFRPAQRASFRSANTAVLRWTGRREKNQKGQSGAPETVLQTLPVRRAT